MKGSVITKQGYLTCVKCVNCKRKSKIDSINDNNTNYKQNGLVMAVPNTIYLVRVQI